MFCVVLAYCITFWLHLLAVFIKYFLKKCVQNKDFFQDINKNGLLTFTLINDTNIRIRFLIHFENDFTSSRGH